MKLKTRQIYDGRWYEVTEYDVCCDCGLTHRVEYKYEPNRKYPLKKRVWRKKKMTKEARKRLKINKLR